MKIMKSKFFLIVALAFIVVVFSSCAYLKQTNKSQENTLLWEVRYKNDTSKVMYFLGSIHIGVKEMYPLNPIIMEAFDKSDVLGVEFDVENFDMSSLGMDLMLKLISFTETLDTKLPSELYQKLKTKLLENEIPETVIDNLTPLGAALMLEVGSIMNVLNSDDNIVDGIDKYFLQLANEQNKEIVEVESLNRQIQVLEEMNEFVVDYISALCYHIRNVSVCCSFGGMVYP
jgi:uncharacterized protein YbaP (TraB family)